MLLLAGATARSQDSPTQHTPMHQACTCCMQQCMSCPPQQLQPNHLQPGYVSKLALNAAARVVDIGVSACTQHPVAMVVDVNVAAVVLLYQARTSPCTAPAAWRQLSTVLHCTVLITSSSSQRQPSRSTLHLWSSPSPSHAPSLHSKNPAPRLSPSGSSTICHSSPAPCTHSNSQTC
jgi:hypothetical protein